MNLYNVWIQWCRDWEEEKAIVVGYVKLIVYVCLWLCMFKSCVVIFIIAILL